MPTLFLKSVSRMKIGIKYQDDYIEYIFNLFENIYDYNKVIYINCNLNNFRLSLLPQLPNSLVELNCDFNQLIELPELPNSLQSLYCLNNQLTSLPELPNSLKRIYCHNNKFIEKIKHKYLIKIIYM